MSGYRDEEGASMARNAALQDEVAALKAENEALKKERASTGATGAGAPRSGKKAGEAAAPEPIATTTWGPPKQRLGYHAVSILVSGALLLGSVVWANSFGFPREPAKSIFLFSLVLAGGGTAGSNLYNALYPDHPILAKDTENGGHYVVPRTRRVRQLYAAISFALFFLGNALFLVWNRQE